MLEQLLDEIAANGWLLNNCYQVDATLWRVNLRRPVTGPDGDWFTDWAEGPTFVEALEDCMSKLASAEFTPTKTSAHSAEPKVPKVNLLHALGLAKPINRRV